MRKTSPRNLNQARQPFWKRVWQNNLYCWVAFLCATALMLLVYFCYSVIPFGDITVLRMDLYHQYGPLFAELYERIVNFDSFTYSWTTGMGSSFLGNFFNYLSSPLSFLVVLFGRDYILECIATVILLKCAISAFTFTYYLKRAQKKHNLATAGFGVLYAFCAFFLAYYWNIMWIDALAIFPLLVLGIERLIAQRKHGLYVGSLAMMLVTNYYMGYMACIFSVLYFVVYYFSHHTFSDRLLEKPAERKGLSDKILDFLRGSRITRTGVRFAGASLLAGGLAAFALLPVYYVLQASSATSGTFPEELNTYFNIADFFANHLAALEPTIRSSGEDVLPNIYCSIATVLLVPLYLFSRSIPVKEKVLHVGLLGIFFLSFNTNYLNFIWHGFHFPNDLPYRFSFMYSFILLIMAFRAMQHLHEFTGRQILGVGTAAVFGIVLLEKMGSKNLDEMTVYVSLGFVVVYTLVFALFQNRKVQSASMSMLFLCCAVAEVAVASTDSYSMDQSKTNYAKDYDSFAEVKQELDAREDGGFYRMELSKLRTRMDPAWYYYNGVSTFSSMAYEKLANLQQRLGMFGNYINSYTYNRQTPVYNMMTSLKYVVDNQFGKPDMNPQIYTEVARSGNFTAYENQYLLPIAYCVNPQMELWETEESYNPFAVQNEYFQFATGLADVMLPLEITDVQFDNVHETYGFNGGDMEFYTMTEGETGSITFTVTPEVSQNVYVYTKSSELAALTARYGDNVVRQDLDRVHIFDLGYCEAGESIELELSSLAESSSGSFTFYIYGLDFPKFEKGYQQLQQEQLEVESFTDTKITGTVNAQQDCLLYTSIPYDEGWTVTVDGVPVAEEDYVALQDALLCIRLSAGEHQITLQYTPRGLYLGLLLSFLAALILLVWFLLSRRYAKQKQMTRPVTETAPIRLETLQEAEESITGEVPDFPAEPPRAEGEDFETVFHETIQSMQQQYGVQDQPIESQMETQDLPEETKE